MLSCRILLILPALVAYAPAAFALSPIFTPDETPIGQLAMLVLPDSLTTSPDSRHLAFGTKETDPVVLAPFTRDKGIPQNIIKLMLDGQSLPPCRLLMPMAFSPDSQHRGYAFCTADQWQIQVDNQIVMNDIDRVPANPIVFSPDSKHTAIVGQKNGKTTIQLDGQPWLDIKSSDGGMLKFSPDSQHLAALLHIATQWTLYIDGKPLAEDTSNPPKRPSHFQRIATYDWTPDSKSLAITAAVPGKTWQIFTTATPTYVSAPAPLGIVKGYPLFVPMTPETNPADASRLCFITPAPDKHWSFHTESPATTPPAPFSNFRPESVHYLLPAPLGSPAQLLFLAADEGGWHLFINGKPVSPAYTSVVENTFVRSPDFHHFAFAAKNGDQTILIRDGKVFATPPAIGVGTLAFSPDSQHLAYGIKQLDGNPLAWHMAIDTTIGTGMFAALSTEPPVFSPDSHTVAYTAKFNENSWRLIVGIDVEGQTRPYSSFLTGAPIVWHDNTHLSAIALPKRTATRLDITLIN